MATGATLTLPPVEAGVNPNKQAEPVADQA